MAKLTLVYWRDIPAQVIVKAGRKSAKRILTDRFAEAIDLAAMRAGKGSTDDYLADWRREESRCDDDLDAVATATAAKLEQDYTDERIRILVKNDGHEPAA